LFVDVEECDDSLDDGEVESFFEKDLLLDLEAVGEGLAGLVVGEVLDALPLVELSLQHLQGDRLRQLLHLERADQQTEHLPNDLHLLVRFLYSGELFKVPHVQFGQSGREVLLLGGLLLEFLHFLPQKLFVHFLRVFGLLGSDGGVGEAHQLFVPLAGVLGAQNLAQ